MSKLLEHHLRNHLEGLQDCVHRFNTINDDAILVVAANGISLTTKDEQFLGVLEVAKELARTTEQFYDEGHL